MSEFLYTNPSGIYRAGPGARSKIEFSFYGYPRRSLLVLSKMKTGPESLCTLGSLLRCPKLGQRSQIRGIMRWGSMSSWTSTTSQYAALISVSMVTQSRRQPLMELGQRRHQSSLTRATPARILFFFFLFQPDEWTARGYDGRFLRLRSSGHTVLILAVFPDELAPPPGFRSLCMCRVCWSVCTH